MSASAAWHHRHVDAAQAAHGLVDLVAHAELEAYSVLTRLPERFRAPAPAVARYLSERFPGERLSLDEVERPALVGRLAGQGITGGAVYDALIAATASAHGHELLTLDARAARVYARVGAQFRLL
ncbi:MAG: PIN domain-containing protein [Thermoleophilaceae bacterium]